jgi:hypothetical protein
VRTREKAVDGTAGRGVPAGAERLNRIGGGQVVSSIGSCIPGKKLFSGGEFES